MIPPPAVQTADSGDHACGGLPRRVAARVQAAFTVSGGSFAWTRQVAG